MPKLFWLAADQLDYLVTLASVLNNKFGAARPCSGLHSSPDPRDPRI